MLGCTKISWYGHRLIKKVGIKGYFDDLRESSPRIDRKLKAILLDSAKHVQ